MYKDSLENVLRKGIWIKSEGDRVKFQSTGIIYTGKNGEKQLDAEILTNDNIMSDIDITDTLAVFIESPLRIQSSAVKLDFSDLIRIMMTRLDSINVLEDKEKCYSKNLIEQAKNVKTLARDIKLENMTRKSSHTNSKTSIDCLVGRVVYQGDFSEYAEIIKKSELVNIGKWTTFGLGRIRTEFI